MLKTDKKNYISVWTSIPSKMLKLVDKYEDSPPDMEKAGIKIYHCAGTGSHWIIR